jgi:NitT/TauT family transport system permease protein
MSATRARPQSFGSMLVVLAGALIVWEIFVHLFQIRPFVLPAPSAIVLEIAERPNFYLKHSLFTMGTTLAGFFLSVVLGVTFAVGIVSIPIVDRIFFTLLIAVNSVPKVAMAPLFVIWLGTGAEPKIAVTLLIAIFSIVIDTVLGLRSVEPDMLALARSAGATRTQTLMKIRFPNALASMFAGMKVAISFALVGAIVGEFVAGDRGLGFVILSSQGMFETTSVFASLCILGLLGSALFFAVEAAERRILPWHVSQRHEAGGHRP